jgi:hypothetical protein
MGLGAAGAGFCAIAMLAPKSRVVAAIGNIFIEIFSEIDFQSCLKLRRSRFPVKPDESSAACTKTVPRTQAEN